MPVAKLPPLEEFLAAHDYLGAQTLLEFELRTGDGDGKTLEWLAYAAFHNGDYKHALGTYKRLLAQAATGGGGPDDESRAKAAAESAGAPSPAAAPAGLLRLYISACLFRLARPEEAEAEATQGLDCPLRTRLLYHCAHKLGRETALLAGNAALAKSPRAEDALCLAAMHVARAHYQEAQDVYKKLLLEKEHKDSAALHFYIALCYYKLDYFDVSLEVLGSYTAALAASTGAAGPSVAFSPAALNLKACNAFKLYNGKAAEVELKVLAESGLAGAGDAASSDLLRHNLVVFRGGEGAPRVLPPLVASGSITEARLNLTIYHLRNDNVEEAAALMRAVSPSTSQEYLLTAVVNTLVGQRGGPGAREAMKTAQQAFHFVGASPSEMDTIPGRCAMASCFFLMRAFEDVSVYLGSVRSYMAGEDAFPWNYGISLGAVGNYRDAEEVLLTVASPAAASDPVFTLWLARCYVMNGKPRAAWELYLRLDSSAASHPLLHLIAADAYSTGAWYFVSPPLSPVGLSPISSLPSRVQAAKAYDVLARLDPSDPSLREGMYSACAGVFAACIAGTESKEALREAVAMLRAEAEGAGPGGQAIRMVAAMRKWGGL
jgi:intraflagellar transport protein 56